MRGTASPACRAELLAPAVAAVVATNGLTVLVCGATFRQGGARQAKDEHTPRYKDTWSAPVGEHAADTLG